MRYEGRVFRPPSEAYSLIVQVTVGCSHNKCTFCDMYKEKRFHLRKLEDVLEDFNIARRQYRYIERVFLADGDALIRKTEDLAVILKHIRKIIPECRRVTSYGSPKSILTKSPEDLALLHSLGLEMIYLGLESGNEQVLKHINKGVTVEDIVRAGQMVKDAGMKLSVTAISGLGGTEMWKEHAIDTAKAFSRMKPDYIGLLTLMFEGDVPLRRECEEGKFHLLTAPQVAKETLLLLEHIDSEGSVFRSNHASNYLTLKGTLNRDREAMCEQIRTALERGGYKKEYFRAL
ncbi:radical SAM protein [Butyricicoccus intestinisimiae]|uniref:Radical SAM protein n=1 Tax=Butyricicoccus intestinisimiae TaxID=2841509 RepID=A0ABS6EQZ5_9FIRM|nr:radical SAM protein [Butyricicoccus intestinisimiae]MBU5489913.1 radical SAM protein [Butyricicoccus intestinisimiae]